MSDVQAARAVCDAATPGPWRAYDLTGNLPYVCTDHCTISDRVFKGFRNAQFIAAAREGWPAALDEIERLRNDLQNAWHQHTQAMLRIAVLEAEAIVLRRDLDVAEREARLLREEVGP